MKICYLPIMRLESNVFKRRIYQKKCKVYPFCNLVMKHKSFYKYLFCRALLLKKNCSHFTSRNYVIAIVKKLAKMSVINQNMN